MKRILTLALALLSAGAIAASAVDLQTHNRTYIMGYGTQAPGMEDYEGLLQYQVGIKAPLLDLTALGIPIEVVGAFSDFALWDVNAESSPFREHNYQPEAWVTWLPDSSGTLRSYLDDVRIGFRHVSTGVDSIDSMGWNRVFLSTDLFYTIEELGLTLHLTPEIWYVVSEDENTEGIGSKDFTGLGIDDFGGKVRLTVDQDLGTLALELGRRHGLAEVTFDLIPGLNQYVVYLQAFRGQMESLNSFDQYRTGFGAGIALSR